TGIVPGPCILAVGRPVTTPDGHMHFLGGGVRGVDELKGLLGELIERGVDAIKVMATGGNMTVTSDPLSPAFSKDELATIVGAAHAAGLRVAAHARGVAGIRAAVEAGVDSVEHARMEVGPGIWGFDGGLAREMAHRGIVAAPT